MGTYRMRFLWADEIDADHAHYQKLLQRWGSDEAIDDMEHAFGSLFLADARARSLRRHPRRADAASGL